MKPKITLESTHSIYCGFFYEAARFLTQHPDLAQAPTVIHAVNDGMMLVWTQSKRPGKDWFIFAAVGDSADEPTIWALPVSLEK